MVDEVTGRDFPSTFRVRGEASALLGLVGALAACTVTEPSEAPTISVRGTVFIAGVPASAGQASVRVFHGELGNPLSAPNGESGSYELTTENLPLLCDGQATLHAFAGTNPFPMESPAALVVPQRLSPCEGVIEGPDLFLPDPAAPLQTVDVSGVVTNSGMPTVANLTLAIQSIWWGPENLATTQSAPDGSYRLQAEIPAHYCDDLRIFTQPQSASLITPSGCGPIAFDFDLNG